MHFTWIALTYGSKAMLIAHFAEQAFQALVLNIQLTASLLLAHHLKARSHTPIVLWEVMKIMW
jgi:hypothetical protein